MTESGAIKKAAPMVPRVPGALALRVVVDDETYELDGATILDKFADMPNDLAASLQGG